jgi:uncharacterized protein with HEPN domain
MNDAFKSWLKQQVLAKCGLSLSELQLYLKDIIEAIKNIQQYTAELTYEEFAMDKRTVDATIRNFEVIGEAAKHIPEKVRIEYPQVPWKNMVKMNNKLIQGVKPDVLWKTIKDRLPIVKPLVEEALAKMDDKKREITE